MKAKKIAVGTSVLVCSLLVVYSCSKDTAYNTNSRTLDLSEDYQYDMGNDEMAKLGRVLFYDKTLSVNNAVSCGSCHKQAFAFSDNRAGSRGFENFETPRNTPPIQNLGFSGFVTLGSISNNSSMGQALFWDGRERILQNMVVQPIFNHVEMGVRNTNDLVRRVKERSYYPELFKDAFQDENVTFERISQALMGFVQNIRSHSSPFDRMFMNASTHNSLSPREQKGMDLFFGKYDCGSCHQLHSPTGYNSGFEEPNSELLNIGLDAVYTDKGLGAVTGNPADDGKFRIPNLRNVALTAPYMHDGRFGTLEEVLDHYSTGIENNTNLDQKLRDSSGKPLVLNISKEDKQNIIAFLHALTDNQMITDPRFSDPFKKY